MMRYQRVSPDCFPLNHGRKFNLRTCKEEDADSSRISNCNGFEGKPLRFKPGSTSQDHNFSQLLSDSSQPENHSPVKTQNNQESGHGGDILLQWGQRKRSRGARAENRLVTDETSTQARQMAKIQRRVISGVEKRAINQAILAGSYTRGSNLRTTCFSVRETTGSLPNSDRNLEERSVTGNCPETSSGNGNGNGNGNGKSRSHSRSAEKRSPSSPEKMDKPASSTVTIANGEKPKGPTVQIDAMNVESVPQSEPEADVAAEKLNLDLFEWPRVYIALSRKEKEDDFFAMKGTKLPQRPKKRAKNVDKTLQYCFPGMWLSDLTRSRYEVREKKCVVKKKRRGLKGMESMDSDSE